MNRPLSIGRVALTVHDLDRVSRFYQEVVGFRKLSRDAASVQLGAGSGVLLELRRNSQARWRSPRDAGLYHVAFLLPDRSDLGCFYRHALSRRLDVRTSDFFASGGYHHHIATNIRNSDGARVRPDPVTGLADIEVVANSQAVLHAVRSRLAPVAEAVTVRDPRGTSITLAVAG